MNKKGFTLVEVIVVISLLGLVVIISSTNILGGGAKAKEKMLETKIKNIEKAAVLYGQDNRDKIHKLITGDKDMYPLCFKEGKSYPIPNCYYYFDTETNSTLITVGELAKTVDDEGNSIEPYIDYDKENNIVNPVDENTYINDCEIQIYQKYGKIYAVYTKTAKSPAIANTKCWID